MSAFIFYFRTKGGLGVLLHTTQYSNTTTTMANKGAYAAIEIDDDDEV
jgi:hypothetical protein